MSEVAFRVSSRTTAEIAGVAHDFLQSVNAENLRGPEPLDLARVFEDVLPQRGIQLYPVDEGELPLSEGETRPGIDDSIEIWLRTPYFDALFSRSSKTRRARATGGHELGHASLHLRELRVLRSAPARLALQRAVRTDLRPFEDSEWQAWTFAEALLLPPATVKAMARVSARDLASSFDVSESFAASYLKRFKRLLVR